MILIVMWFLLFENIYLKNHNFWYYKCLLLISYALLFDLSFSFGFNSCLHPGAPSTLCTSRGAVYTACILGLCPLHAHLGHCLHHLRLGAPSTLCTSRGAVHTVCVLGLHPRHAHPGALSTPRASRGAVHTMHIQGRCPHHLRPGGSVHTADIQGCSPHCLHPRRTCPGLPLHPAGSWSDSVQTAFSQQIWWLRGTIMSRTDLHKS